MTNIATNSSNAANHARKPAATRRFTTNPFPSPGAPKKEMLLAPFSSRSSNSPGIAQGYKRTLILVLAALSVSTLLGLIPLYGTKIVFDSVLREQLLLLRDRRDSAFAARSAGAADGCCAGNGGAGGVVGECESLEPLANHVHDQTRAGLNSQESVRSCGAGPRSCIASMTSIWWRRVDPARRCWGHRGRSSRCSTTWMTIVQLLSLVVLAFVDCEGYMGGISLDGRSSSAVADSGRRSA